MAKTLLFAGFRSRHDLRFFGKRVNTSVFLRSSRQKNRFKKCKKCCNLQGFGAVTGKKLRKYQRFSAQKWLKHRYLQCFVPSAFSWNCKNTVNTSIFLRSTCQKCCNLQCFFCCAFSGPKSIGIYSIFCVFAWLPQKTAKRKNAVIYSILWLSKSEKSSEKCVKTALFSDFRYPPNGGGPFALGDAYERPGFRPKSSPPPSWRIFGVFRGPPSEGRRLGARLTLEL